MSIFLKTLSAILLFAMSFSVFAASNRYMIVVDAGSSGSRLHVFQVDKTASMPVVTDIFSENVKPGLSSFADTPQLAGASLKKPLDDAMQVLLKQEVDTHTVLVSVLGTGGMRLLLKDKQKAIYASVKKYIREYYAFAPKNVHAHTISGKMEGFYGWTDVNYLQGNFQQHRTTVGSIDMGGASTQIAYAIPKNQRIQSSDTVTVTINNEPYTVFSKSFLGLGQDAARTAINKDPAAGTCYPKNYLTTGNFNFLTCKGIYTGLIESQQMPVLSVNDTFVAYSGIYYTWQFFNVDKKPDQAVIEQAVKTVCYEPWEQLQKEHPTDKYLSGYCANASYEDQLLYGTYGLQGDRLTIENQINGQGIDWPLGAALYSLVK